MWCENADSNDLNRMVKDRLFVKLTHNYNRIQKVIPSMVSLF